MLRSARQATAKPRRMGTSASGDGGGAAVPARRAKAAPRVTRTTFLAWCRPRSRLPALLHMKANPTRTNPTSSPVWFAPIKRQAASGDPAGADVVADAAGAAGWRRGWAGLLWADPGRDSPPEATNAV